MTFDFKKNDFSFLIMFPILFFSFTIYFSISLSLLSIALSFFVCWSFFSSANAFCHLIKTLYIYKTKCLKKKQGNTLEKTNENSQNLFEEKKIKNVNMLVIDIESFL